MRKQHESVFVVVSVFAPEQKPWMTRQSPQVFSFLFSISSQAERQCWELGNAHNNYGVNETAYCLTTVLNYTTWLAAI